MRHPRYVRVSSRQTQPCRRRSSSSTVRLWQTTSSFGAVIIMPNPHAAPLPRRFWFRSSVEERVYRSGLPDKLPHADRLVAPWLRRLCYRSSAEEMWFGSVTDTRGRTQHFALSYCPLARLCYRSSAEEMWFGSVNDVRPRSGGRVPPLPPSLGRWLALSPCGLPVGWVTFRCSGHINMFCC